MGDTPRRRRAVIARDGPNCHYCGAPPPKDGYHTLDHVIPKSMGGTSRIENLVLACIECNQAKGGVHGPGAHQPGLLAKKPSEHDKYVANHRPVVPAGYDPEFEKMLNQLPATGKPRRRG